MRPSLGIFLVLAVGCAPPQAVDAGWAPTDAAPTADAFAYAEDHTDVRWISSAADLSTDATTAFWTGEPTEPVVYVVAAPRDRVVTCDDLTTEGWLTQLAGVDPSSGRPRASLLQIRRSHLGDDTTLLSGAAMYETCAGYPRAGDAATSVWPSQLRSDDVLVGRFHAVYSYCIAPTADVEGIYVATHCAAVGVPELSH